MSNSRISSSLISKIGLLITIFCLTTQINVCAAPSSKTIIFWDDSEETSELQINHSSWDSLLKKYVKADHPSGVNRFDYNAVTTKDNDILDQYLKYLQLMEPRQLNKNQQKAYWLNLFNAVIVQQIIDAGPSVKTVKSLGGRLWTRKRLYISMQKTSLDDIEHGILRPIFNDPRVHFALASGAIGSASILPLAFTEDNVEELLENNTRDFLTHSRGVSFQDNKLTMSSIFKWYRADFGGNLKGIKEFISPYLSESSAQALARANKASYNYNWSINKIN